MARLARSFIAATILLCWVSAVSAQTADEIVEKHLAAIGGRAALAKIKSRSMTGTMTVSVQGMDISGTIELVNQEPNKSRSLIKLDLSALGVGQMIIDQRFDGVTGYVIDTLRGNREITGSQLDAMKNGSFPNPLLSYKEAGITLELAGKEKVGEGDAYVMILKPKAGPAVRQYIDAQSMLPVRAVVTVEDPQVGAVEQTTELLDYRDVDGIKVPFQVNTVNAFQRSTIIITKVEHNGKIDETVFSKP
jgi:outer membrane lipoprotein-sorting protein